MLGLKGIPARTDYLVNGKRDCLVFLTASKSNGKEGRPFCARTTDGGLTWKLVSGIGPEPAGFAIMPSTVRLGPAALLTTVRHKEEPHNGIDAYISAAGGANWRLPGNAAPSAGGKSGNPPRARMCFLELEFGPKTSREEVSRKYQCAPPFRGCAT